MQSKTILLLGAGFSRNWGGWLASEAFEYLLGSKHVDRALRDLLWHHRDRGFESALSQLQSESNSLDDRLRRMQNALSEMFIQMEEAFEGIQFNISNEHKISISSFLAKFDAIFTLNQDLLLERFYVGEVGTPSIGGGKWERAVVPGIKNVGTDFGAYSGLGRFMEDETAFRLEERSQPIIKLHGSANWRTSKDTEVVIMGANKSGAIGRFPLLSWYSNLFKEYLNAGSTKVMVIGYSFSDDHINRSLMEAASRFQLRLFVVDPLGADVIDRNRHLRGPGSVYAPDPTVVELWPALVGASRRPLRSTFDSDRVEFQKLLHFFDA
jgi:SIR2-like domain